MDEFVRGNLLSLVVFVVLNLLITIILKLKSKDKNLKDENTIKRKIGPKIFSLMIIPTIVLVFLVAKTFFDFISIYLYFIMFVLISDRIETNEE